MTRTYSCLTPLPPAARTTRKNMASLRNLSLRQTTEESDHCKCKSRHIGKIPVPTFLQKPSVDPSKINGLLQAPSANMSNMGYWFPKARTVFAASGLVGTSAWEV